jgi:hypothetical protein
MFQWYIKQYGLQGNGAGPVGASPYQLMLLTPGIAGMTKNAGVWLKDYVSLAAAKTSAVALFAAETGGTSGTFSLDTTSASWVDTYPLDGAATAPESLSILFTPTF